MLALLCCRCGGSEIWDGEGAEGASATGSSPRRRRPQREGGGGGGAWSMSAIDVVAFGGAAADPGVGMDAAATRGYSRPTRCG